MKGHIRRRGHRSWAVVLDVGRDPSGKRRQRWHTVNGTKRDAERALTQLVHSLNTGGYVEPSKITVKEFLTRWLADYAHPKTSGKTYERYAQIVHSNLIPSLGHHALMKLQPLHIQEFYSQALGSGRRDGKGGLSPQTVLHFHRVLHQALGQAVRWQLLARNPAEAVEPPRPQHREMTVLSEVDTIELLNAAENSRLKIPLVLAVTTGMRRGEIAALAWREVDLTGRNADCRSFTAADEIRLDLQDDEDLEGTARYHTANNRGRVLAQAQSPAGATQTSPGTQL